jgi:ribonuclease D
MTTDPQSRHAAPSMAPKVIQTQGQLEALCRELLRQPVVAVDTESNSLYAYKEQVCLIQFSTSISDYVVDPLADVDIHLLGAVFSDADIEKVFHAAEYDVICLKRDFGFTFANLFDTMWAARILGWERVGLGDVLEEQFGVDTNKRYQRHNWGKRPLDKAALQYAAIDTHYLIPLRHLQTEALVQVSRLEEAEEVAEFVAQSENAHHEFDPEDFRRIKGAARLSGAEQAVLRQVFIWRDGEARRQNRPPFKVVSNSVLLTLARTQPREIHALFGVRGLKPRHVRRYGLGILEAVAQGSQSDRPAPPEPFPRHSDEEKARFQRLRSWRKLVAAQRGVDVDVIVSNAVLWALARRAPKTRQDLEGIAGFGPWKQAAYGRGILDALPGRAHDSQEVT